MINRTTRSTAAVALAVSAGVVLSSCSAASAPDSEPGPATAETNLLTGAVAWRVTAAERDTLYRQGFNIARDRVDAALAQDHEKPLAVIADVDDTVLSSDSYWQMLLDDGQQAFDDPMWDEWVAENGPTATPGAVEFASYAEEQGVEIFYVSTRDQGEQTQEYGVANLEAAGLPFADDEHATFERETSDKEPKQQEIAEKFEVVAYLGDNLNDFQRRYYVESVTERAELAAEDADEFGRKFILFPNPTDGHWVKAIFGDSEPADSPEYRERFAEAATRGE